MDENQKKKLIEKPIVFASSAFILSGVFASIFYIIVYCFQKVCSSINNDIINSAISHLSSVPLSAFDGILILLMAYYTFKYKEKFPFLKMIKISVYFTFFVSIRTLILWNFTPHSTVKFYYIMDVIGTIAEVATSLFSFIALKIMNVICLKYSEKVEFKGFKMIVKEDL